MKRFIINLIVIAAISLLGIMWINSDVFSQEIPIQEQIKNMNIEIPFVDRDGDGINDLLQNGWGLRFLRRFKNRGAVWAQMMENEDFGNTLIDTNGDGVPDTSLREIFQQRMDSNGDGVFDTAWGEFMRRRFELFDQNGDGIPDELTPEQIREHFQEMREWMQMMRENLKNGLPAFVDEDGDGIPDNLPQGFGWMKRHKGKSKGGSKGGGL